MERAVGMGSTSNRRHTSTDFIAAMSENSTFDLNQGLANIVFRRNGLSLHEYLGVPERSEPPSPTSATDLFQISENEDSVLENSAPMQLLNQAEQERADLLLIYPKAKIKGNCITEFHYSFIVKLFLYKLKVSEEMPHPEAIARLLCRLSRELKSAPSFGSDNPSARFSDPADYDGCLGEMLKDMEDYIKSPDTPPLPVGYVYVRRGTDTYAQFLLAAATELHSSSS